MDFHDLSINLGVFNDAESIYDTYKVIRNEYHGLPDMIDIKFNVIIMIALNPICLVFDT